METTKPHAPKVYAKGRRCRTCDGFLSIYNPYPRCSKCKPQRERVRPGEHHDAVGEMLALISQEDD